MLKKTLFTLGCAAASLGFSSSASAANIQFTLNPPTGSFLSENIGCDAGSGACAGDFSAMGSFAAPEGYSLVQGSIETNSFPGDDLTNIDFSTATLNGQTFELLSLGDGLYEFGFLSPIALQTVNDLVVNGYTGGSGTFTGSLTFGAGAVPEPATWALMILGFGVVGMGLRRRERQNVSAKLNFA